MTTLPINPINPFKPPAHPQKAALWLMAVYMGIGVVGTQVLGAPDISLSRLPLPLALLGLIALAFPRIVSHLPPAGGRSVLYALYQGLWFGLFMSVFLPGPDATFSAVWMQISVSGGIFGLIHYAFITDRDLRQANTINAFYTDTSMAQPGYAVGWACGLLGLGLGLSVMGVPMAWVLLVMVLLLNGAPFGRPIAPAHARPSLRFTLRLLRVGLAALAAGTILMNGG